MHAILNENSAEELLTALSEIKRLKSTVQALRDETDRLVELHRNAIQSLESRHRQDTMQLQETILAMRKRVDER
jgi:hypothetical protein